MPEVLGEHQFIMLENFETIYISINRTVPFMSQSFIACSAILCLFMQNDRSLWVSSLIPSIPPQKHLCRLKRNFINLCKISFNKRYLLYTYICYTLLLPFKKLVLVLMITKAWRNSSMAKQPIKSCVSNQSRTCGKA